LSNRFLEIWLLLLPAERFRFLADRHERVSAKHVWISLALVDTDSATLFDLPSGFQKIANESDD